MVFSVVCHTFTHYPERELMGIRFLLGRLKRAEGPETLAVYVCLSVYLSVWALSWFCFVWQGQEYPLTRN